MKVEECGLKLRGHHAVDAVHPENEAHPAALRHLEEGGAIGLNGRKPAEADGDVHARGSIKFLLQYVAEGRFATRFFVGVDHRALHAVSHAVE